MSDGERDFIVNKISFLKFSHPKTPKPHLFENINNNLIENQYPLFLNDDSINIKMICYYRKKKWGERGRKKRRSSILIVLKFKLEIMDKLK